MNRLRGTSGSWITALVLCALIRTATQAGEAAVEPEWPQWRGPAHDAISRETGLADEWPADGPPVLWAKELGQGYSSFIAVGDRVWTQTQTLYEQAVVCLNADTGETIWSSRYGWPYEGGGLYPGPRSTPTWHDGRIYFAAPDGTIGCLNAANGSSIWSTNPTKTHRGRGTDFGYSCSPVIVDGKVIVPVGGADASVIALSAKDGSLMWGSGESPASYASPLPISFQGRRLIVTPLENTLAIFDVATGRLLWEDEVSQGYDEHSAAPLYREPLLMVASPFKAGAKCVRLQEETVVEGEPLQLKPVRAWENVKFSNDIASSVLVDGCIYGFDLKDAQSRVNRPSRGEFRCLDFETGQILWSADEVGHASAIVADGKLILFNDKGEVILARINAERFEELARTQVFHDEICWSPPALHRGRLYLRTQTRAVCLYLGREPLASKQPTQTVATIPRGRAFDPSWLLAGEREYPATTPEWSELRGWYLWSMAGLLLATALATMTQVIVSNVQRLSTRFVTCHCERIVFWTTAILVGALGSPLLNRRLSEYVFLWPVVLWVSLQLTLLATTWAEAQPMPARRRARWISRLAGLGFIATSALYFHLCRRLGLSIEWGFLTGFLPAFPVAALAARGLLSQHRLRLLTDLALAAASFTVYFWSCSLFIKWWLQVGS